MPLPRARPTHARVATSGAARHRRHRLDGTSAWLLLLALGLLAVLLTLVR